ncbi:MAG: GGDEF domain-containing protein [Actinomycetes bacterium]
MSAPSGERVDSSRRDVTAARFRALAAVARVPTTATGTSLLRDIARAAREALDGASVSMSRWEPEHGLVRCLINEGDLSAIEEPEPLDETYTLLEYRHLSVLIEDQAALVVVIDQDDDGGGYVKMLQALGKGSCVAAPIPLDGRVWGELFVTRTLDQPPFSEADGDLAVAVAAQVGAAIATAEHLNRVERLARTDPLTGLANRRAFDDRLDEAFAPHGQSVAPISLIVCDLNGLKRLNDEQGHEAGDRALVRFAGLLSTTAARLPGALAARLGGDEFCVVVTDASPDDVVAAAEELCRAVQRSPLEGVSCGVVSTGDDVGEVTDPARLLRLADAAQYRAKRSRSARPVVAGRTLPAETAVRLSEHPLHERRSIRGRLTPDGGRLVDLGLVVLDDLRDRTAQERLAALGDLVGHQVDALGWWLSSAPEGASYVETCQFALFRSNPGVSTGLGEAGAVGARFELADYPLTAALLGGGGHCVHASEPGADPAEVAILDGMGAVAVAVVGSGSAVAGRWLLEVFGDEMSGSLDDVLSAIRVLALVAVAEAAAD